MNSVQKVRFRRQNEPLPKAKFVRVNQHTKSERGKSITKIHPDHSNKKVVKRPSETDNKELKVCNKR